MSSEVAIGRLMKGSEMFIRLVATQALRGLEPVPTVSRRWYSLGVARLTSHRKQPFSGHLEDRANFTKDPHPNARELKDAHKRNSSEQDF